MKLNTLNESMDNIEKALTTDIDVVAETDLVLADAYRQHNEAEENIAAVTDELDKKSEMDGSPRVCLQKINSTFILGWQKQIGKYSDENAINRKYEEYIQAFFDKSFESMFLD